MTSEYNLVLNPNKCKSIESGIVLSQGDFGAVFKIKVEELDTASTTCTIAFRKKSGSVEATGLTASAGVYSYALRGTELDTPGRVVCDLKFKEGTSKRISTASFIFDVVPDTLNGLHEEAHSYSDSILQMRQQIVEEARADLVKPMTYKGVVASVSNLPASGNANADFYIVSGNDHIYVWNGTIWTDAGPAVTQISIIDDNVIGDNTTWSSSKINRDLAELSGGTGIHHVIKNLGTIWSGLESIDYNHGIVGIHNVLSAHVLLVHPTTHTAYTLPYFSAANVVVSSVLKVDHNTLSLKANSTAGWSAYNVILDIWFD